MVLPTETTNGPTCYERIQWEMSGVPADLRLQENAAMQAEAGDDA